jgi:YVTN family beta-propeller protein
MQTPHQTVPVQALRNARLVEEIAHGQSQGRFSFFPFSDCGQRNGSRARRRKVVMPLKAIGTIAIPAGAGSEFDHAAFDANSRRVFIAHTARDCVEVIDHDAGGHIATLPGFPGVAGAVADGGYILVTNRGSASVALLDANSLKTRATFKAGARPNGAVIIARSGLAIAACIGHDKEAPTLQLFGLSDHKHVSIDLPRRPRWCVTDAAAERVFLCIRQPSMVLVARLPDLGAVTHWKIPSSGAHGLDIDHSRGLLYVACDDSSLVEMSSSSGEVTNIWPIAGPPDVTFFNPATGLVHVAIGEPGLVETIDPHTGQGARTVTGVGAHTTALVAPDRLYVISPAHGGILVFSDT